MHFMFNKRNHTYWMTVLYCDLLLHFHISRLIKYFYNATFTKSIDFDHTIIYFSSLLFLVICVNGLHRIIEKPITKELDTECDRGKFFEMKYNSSSQIWSSSALSKRLKKIYFNFLFKIKKILAFMYSNDTFSRKDWEEFKQLDSRKQIAQLKNGLRTWTDIC